MPKEVKKALWVAWACYLATNITASLLRLNFSAALWHLIGASVVLAAVRIYFAFLFKEPF
jgi:hypothetical protein